jgi:hypothetical protein
MMYLGCASGDRTSSSAVANITDSAAGTFRSLAR